MFKKIISLLTVSAVFCSFLSIGFGGSAAYEDTTLYGDVNGDGAVDTDDARLALRLAAGVEILENEAQLKRADVNFDGAVTVFDARQILRGAAGLATLQPSGAFSGFDGGGNFSNEEALATYFNATLNRLKVVKTDADGEENRYIAATVTKTENDNLTDFNIKEVELPAFGIGTNAEGIASIVRDKLTEDDKKDDVTVIPYGSNDFSLISVEDADYVSMLTATDIFGSKATYNADEGLITLEVALPDTEMEMAAQSAYSKTFNTSYMLNEQNTTLMKLIKTGSGETAMLREFKNCVLKIVFEVATGNVQSYTVSYESKVYVAQTNFGLGSSLSVAKLKGIEFKKQHFIKYEFQWPVA